MPLSRPKIKSTKSTKSTLGCARVTESIPCGRSIRHAQSLPSDTHPKCKWDSLRFHWRRDQHTEIETLCFTRALFRLAPSPFLLRGVLKAHLDAWEERHLDMVAELQRSLYVDNLLTGGQITSQAQQRKDGSIQILDNAPFQLHKWHLECQAVRRK